MKDENKYKTKKEIVKEFDNIFNAYKYYLYNEYKITGTFNYKNILITSILNRSLALIEAYKSLLPSNNIMVLNSLIRLQLDNCIFVYAMHMLVDAGYNIDDLGENIIHKNRKLSSYKIGKQKMTDFYLISKIDEKYGNKIKEMYNFYCRFVHFSDSALISSSQLVGNNGLSIGITKDYTRFKKHIIVNANSFVNLCKFLLILIRKEWKDIPNGKNLV